MNRRAVFVVAALALLLLALGVATAALAQTSPNYNLEWHVIGGGGYPISSAHYTVDSTIGQGAASPPLSANLHYAVSGGYWYSSSRIPIYLMYLPTVLKASD